MSAPMVVCTRYKISGICVRGLDGDAFGRVFDRDENQTGPCGNEQQERGGDVEPWADGLGYHGLRIRFGLGPRNFSF